MGLWQSFKDFALKGSVIDLAVAVALGTAFVKIAEALVVFIIMPLLDKVFHHTYDTWTVAGMKIGLFLAAIFNFFILAFALFLIVIAVRRGK